MPRTVSRFKRTYCQTRWFNPASNRSPSWGGGEVVMQMQNFLMMWKLFSLGTAWCSSQFIKLLESFNDPVSFHCLRVICNFTCDLLPSTRPAATLHGNILIWKYCSLIKTLAKASFLSYCNIFFTGNLIKSYQLSCTVKSAEDKTLAREQQTISFSLRP